MPSWEDLSRESARSARLLLDEELIRGSISRSYYAAYAAVTGALVARGVVFAQRRPNPAHRDLPGHVERDLHGLSATKRGRLARRVEHLYHMRIAADYVPAAQLDTGTARDALRTAQTILVQLGVLW